MGGGIFVDCYYGILTYRNDTQHRKLMSMNKSDLSEHYIAPNVICIHYSLEGVLCSSPGDPGYGGNEDMEEGDEL